MKHMTKPLTLAIAFATVAGAQDASVAEKVDAIDGKLTGLEESYLETKSDVGGLKKLKIGGLAQVRFQHYTDTNLISTSAPYQQNQFLVRRGRLKATYDAGNGSSYVVQYNITEKGLAPVDVFFKWNEPWLKTFSVQGGLQAIPFGYELGYSSSTMEWLERSRFLNNTMLAGENDVGVVLAAVPKVPGLDKLELKFGFMNGYGVQAAGPQDPSNFIGRLSVAKNFADAGVGTSFGASYFQDQRTVLNKGFHYYEVDGSAEYMKKDVPGEDLTSRLIGVDAQVTVDLSMVPGLAGAKFMGEFYTGTANGNKSGNKRTTSNADTICVRNIMGWYAAWVQNIGKSFQTVVRYDVYDPNTDVSGDEIADKAANYKKGNATSKADLAYSTLYLGLNWFATGNMKFTIGYDLIANETTKHLNTKIPATNFSEEIKDDVVTLQGQFAF